jgi:Protein of unknown function (DUF2806)
MENLIGELTKPATMLIEKICDAFGGYFKPWQIRRVAQAEADADRIKTIAQKETEIEITDMTRRALGRFLIEETNKQNNMELITSKAIPHLKDASRPQEINNDWITNFFDKCRLVSDEDMQELWGKVLAGEANSPGKYSKRTVNFLESLDKSDAKQFTTLCGFAWFIGDVVPLIFLKDEFNYGEYNINFNVLKHLDDIGLLTFDHLDGFKKVGVPKFSLFSYYGTPLIIEFKNQDSNEINVGNVLLSKIGKELADICGSKPVPSFPDFVINKWMKEDLKLSSPFLRK